MKLTLTPHGGQTYLIRAAGTTVGAVIGTYNAWDAHLWTRPGVWQPPSQGETIITARLDDLRNALRQRLTDQGPWWTEENT